MQIVKARWKFDGLYKADANIVANEIASIGDSATPEQILEKGRDANSELHKCFEWEDTVAAEKWRIQQARQIVCSLVVVRPKEEVVTKPPVRVFYKVDSKSGSGYKPAQIVYKKQGEYESLLKRAMAELQVFKEKYRMLTELQEIFEEIENLMS